MNTASHPLTEKPLNRLDKRLKRAVETLDVRRTDYPRSSIWEEAWVDCLVQACVATPWIIVSAVGRLFFQPHG